LSESVDRQKRAIVSVGWRGRAGEAAETNWDRVFLFARLRTSGDEQGFRVVVEDDPERLQHGAEEVPVVQPRDGSVAVLERI
jgi:hypothetical protein